MKDSNSSVNWKAGLFTCQSCLRSCKNSFSTRAIYVAMIIVSTFHLSIFFEIYLSLMKVIIEGDWIFISNFHHLPSLFRDVTFYPKLICFLGM